MKHYLEKFDDNCYELSILRQFRDNYVSKEDIDRYYQTDSCVVSAIEATKNAELVYDYIYDNIVDYCVRSIENGDYANAYNRYMTSILSLEEVFVKKSLQLQLLKILRSAVV